MKARNILEKVRDNIVAGRVGEWMQFNEDGNVISADPLGWFCVYRKQASQEEQTSAMKVWREENLRLHGTAGCFDVFEQKGVAASLESLNAAIGKLSG